MMNNEKLFKVLEIIFGVIGGALLVVILVLKLMQKDVTVLTYPIVAAVALFLISDEIKRAIRRRREWDEAEQKREAHPEADKPEPVLPEEAFTFDRETDGKQP